MILACNLLISIYLQLNINNLCCTVFISYTNDFLLQAILESKYSGWGKERRGGGGLRPEGGWHPE